MHQSAESENIWAVYDEAKKKIASLEQKLVELKTAANSLRNKIVIQNDRLALKIAHRLNNYKDFGEALDLPDLEQLCRMGLIKGVERFDPLTGNAPSSFLVPWMYGEVLHHARDRGTLVKVPRRWRELKNESENFTKSFIEKEGRDPTDQELAAHLNIPIDEWLSVQQAHQNQGASSLEKMELESGYEPPDENSEGFAIAELSRRELIQKIAALTIPVRTYATQVCLHQISVEEVASQHGLTPDEVKSELFQAFNIALSEETV